MLFAYGCLASAMVLIRAKINLKISLSVKTLLHECVEVVRSGL